MEFSRQEYWRSHQGIFPNQGSNPCLPHCRQILFCLSHEESPIRNLEKIGKVTLKNTMKLNFPIFSQVNLHTKPNLKKKKRKWRLNFVCRVCRQSKGSELNDYRDLSWSYESLMHSSPSRNLPVKQMRRLIFTVQMYSTQDVLKR